MKFLKYFLDENCYLPRPSYSDSKETRENAEIAVKEEVTVNNDTEVKVKMVPGGGFAAWLEPER